MPRGQKSKVRAREKRRQAQEEPKNAYGAEATKAKEESPSSSSLEFNDIPQGSSVAGGISNQEEHEMGLSVMAAAVAAVSRPRSNKGTNNQEKKPNVSQVTTEQWQEDLLEQKVYLLVHYLLYKYQVKELITKIDMIKIIHVQKNRFPEILRRASEHLELVFGLDMKEVDPIRNIYVLVNKLELGNDGRVNDERGIPKTGLLMTVLGVIFTKGNCATEEQVWEVLNMMGVYDGRKHFIFGEPRKFLTKDLVKERYLKYQQVPNSDPPRYQFLWGPRAHAETSKMKVLEFLAKIHDTNPSAFPSLHAEALRDEEERAQARATARARSTPVASSPSKVMSTCPK